MKKREPIPTNRTTLWKGIQFPTPWGGKRRIYVYINMSGSCFAFCLPYEKWDTQKWVLSLLSLKISSQSTMQGPFLHGAGGSIYLPMWVVHILWLLRIILMTPNVKKKSLLLCGKEVYYPINGLFWTTKISLPIKQRGKGNLHWKSLSKF